MSNWPSTAMSDSIRQAFVLLSLLWRILLTDKNDCGMI